MKPQTHGGTRKGAGRKPSPNAYTPYPTRLPPHLLAWMRQNRKTNGTSVNKFIISAIAEKMQRSKMFQQTLDKYNANFAYDETAKTWCLYGTTRDGLAWETDDYDAETREQAENDAIEYLETNNA